MTATPRGLATGGRALWKAVTDEHELDAVQEVQLLEACRAKDRLDKLDLLLRGDVPNWAVIAEDRLGDLELKIDAALSQANSTANQMKQLLAALRLPDEKTGKKPQQRGGARGSYKTAAPAKVTSMDKFRQAAGG
ncbi:MAG: hypothetical protein ABW046_20515 [Actinoplanes sp.]